MFWPLLELGDGAHLFSRSPNSKDLACRSPAGPRGDPLLNPRGPEAISPQIPGDLTSELLPSVRGMHRRPDKAAGLLGWRAQQFACCSVSRIPYWYDPAIHGTPMMARAARSRQASSVARQISSCRHINNLQAKEKIFEQSVALGSFTPDVEECPRKKPPDECDLQLVQQVNRSFGG